VRRWRGSSKPLDAVFVTPKGFAEKVVAADRVLTL
jgi:hypothetical protein